MYLVCMTDVNRLTELVSVCVFTCIGILSACVTETLKQSMRVT